MGDRLSQSEAQSAQKSGRKTARIVPSVKKYQDAWIASSFDDFGDSASKLNQAIEANSTTQPSKRIKCHVGRRMDAKPPTGNKSQHDLWADKYHPKCQLELAVHKKKIQELSDWLQINICQDKKQAPMLLLNGPAGTGKTTTLRVLCRELGVGIQEWSNPTFQVYDADSWNNTDFKPVGGSLFVSQTSQFQDFLLRANRYPSLEIFQQAIVQRKVILVEEFPNVFFRNTTVFHDILRSYQVRGQCPLVFIISDSAGGESAEKLLFPKVVQADLGLFSISFNPVAATSLLKVLTTIATQEATQSDFKLQVPSKLTLESLAAASSGDIRGAVNALQFACLKDTSDLNEDLFSSTTVKKSQKQSRGSRVRARKKVSIKGPPDGDGARTAIGGRDTSLFLFRALGKILYCKRGDKADFPEFASLPGHLALHDRNPLLVSPEEVIDKAQLSGDFFSAYLHQNYLDFFSKLHDVEQASAYFSDVDNLTTDWTNRTALREYAASVAARSVMFCNSDRASSSGSGKSGLGFKPLHKPNWFDINRKHRANNEAARQLFRGSCWTPDELHLNYLPYIREIGVQLTKPGQMAYVKENAVYLAKQVIRERLDEKDGDFLGSDDDDLTTPGNQPIRIQVQSMQDSSTITMETETKDDEIEIEDFDD